MERNRRGGGERGWGGGEVKFSLTALFKEIKRGERVSYANVL